MDYDLCLLPRMPLRKQISMSKQSDFARAACINYWKSRTMKLDDIRKELSFYDYAVFVRVMRDHFKSLRFDASSVLETLVPLEGLNVTKLTNVTEAHIDNTLSTIHQWELQALPAFLPNLKWLTVSFDVTSDFISNFTKLETLQIEGGMSCEAIDAICRQCAHLKSLRIFEVDNNLSLRAVKYSQSLMNIYIGITTYRTWSQSVLAIPNLNELNIYRYGVCSETIAHWLEITKGILSNEKTEKIRVFKIDATSFTYEKWLNFVPLYKCVRLQFLGLVHCDFSQISPAICCANPTIEVLCLNVCKNLRGAQIVALVEKCPLLRKLCLSDCFTMNRDVIESISKVRERLAANKRLKICVANYDKTDLELKWQYDHIYGESPVTLGECLHSDDSANKASENLIYVRFHDV